MNMYVWKMTLVLASKIDFLVCYFIRRIPVLRVGQPGVTSGRKLKYLLHSFGLGKSYFCSSEFCSVLCSLLVAVLSIYMCHYTAKWLVRILIVALLFFHIILFYVILLGRHDLTCSCDISLFQWTAWPLFLQSFAGILSYCMFSSNSFKEGELEEWVFWTIFAHFYG